MQMSDRVYDRSPGSVRRARLSSTGFALAAAIVIAVIAAAVLARPTVTVTAMPPNKTLPTFGDIVKRNNLN